MPVLHPLVQRKGKNMGCGTLHNSHLCKVCNKNKNANRRAIILSIIYKWPKVKGKVLLISWLLFNGAWHSDCFDKELPKNNMAKLCSGLGQVWLWRSAQNRSHSIIAILRILRLIRS
jgi:hypothetical protein